MVYKLKPEIICHIHCQRCCVCGVELGPGARICVDQRTRRLLCVMHAEPTPDFPGSSSTSYTSNHSGSSGTPIVGSSFKISSSNPNPVIKAESSGPMSPPGCSTGGRMQFGDSVSGSAKAAPLGGAREDQRQQQIVVGGSCSSSRYVRRRGPRTTIRPMQLETLNRIFGTTPKPSKQARARLALETGLSMRVIQVRRNETAISTVT